MDRAQLQLILELLLGTSNVYFQPPASVEMRYPCIVYSRETYRPEFADNGLYHNKTRYQVTVIDRNPDSQIPPKVAKLQYCAHDRFFVKGNLNHDVFTLYF